MGRSHRVVWRCAGWLGAGWLSLAGVLEGQPFQGRIRMQLRTTGGAGPSSQAADYFVKGDRARLELPGVMGGVAMLVASGASRMTLLLMAQRQFAETAMPGAADVATPPTSPRITRTGRTESIAGLPCVHVEVAAEGQVADLCLTTALGRLAMNPMDAMGRASGGSAWVRALGADEFPLRVTLPGGVVGLEVTAVERKRLSADLFSVPLEYSRMEPPARR